MSINKKTTEVGFDVVKRVDIPYSLMVTMFFFE